MRGGGARVLGPPPFMDASVGRSYRLWVLGSSRDDDEDDKEREREDDDVLWPLRGYSTGELNLVSLALPRHRCLL